MKFYVLIFNILMCLFLGGGILVSLGNLFKEAHWSKNARSFTGIWKKISSYWFLLLIPFVFWSDMVYPWKQMEGHKSLYFSSDFLWARQALYVFGLWIAMRVVERKAPLSLILFFLIGSFFSFDWALSLETLWFSNMYGFLYLSSGAQAAMSLMVFRGFKDNDIPTKKDLVHLLLTISLLWFYLNFSQFIIIWMGNLPREAGWYVERMTGWTVLVWFIFGALKLVPIFLISFFKNYKIKNQLIQGISLLIFLGFILEMIWLLLPSMQGVHS